MAKQTIQTVAKSPNYIPLWGFAPAIALQCEKVKVTIFLLLLLERAVRKDRSAFYVLMSYQVDVSEAFTFHDDTYSTPVLYESWPEKLQK